MAPITPPVRPFMPFRRPFYGLAFGSGAPQQQQTPQGGNYFSALAQQMQGGYGGGGGGGGGMGSINSQVLGIINPQLQAAADAINRRSQLGSSGIGALTNAYQQNVGALAAGTSGIFRPAEKSTRATAGYARDALTNAGQAKFADLNAALSQAGQRGPGDVNLQQQGAGAGQAAYGTGIAELDALIARAAAAQTQTALEPSFAAGMGQQQQSLLAAQLARQLADNQGQIMAQVPGLVDTLTQRQLAAQQDARDFAENQRQFNAQQGLSEKQFAAQQAAQARAEQQRKAGIAGPNAPTVAGRVAYWNQVAAQRTHDTGVLYTGTSTGIRPVDTNPKKLGIQSTYTLQGQAAAVGLGKTFRGTDGRTYRYNSATGRAELIPGQAGPKAAKPVELTIVHKADGSVVAVNPTTGATVQQISGPKAPKVTKPTTYTTADGRRVVYDPKTHTATLVGGYNPAKPAKPAAGGKPPTAAQTNALIEQWYNGKPTTVKQRQPNLDKNGNPVYKTVQGPRAGQISYQQAYTRLRAMGYDDTQARGYLDTRWKRGERGRPWVAATQRQTLAKAGLKPVARYYKGHAYLEDRQVAALKAAGMLPAGEWVGGRYYIKPGY